MNADEIYLACRNRGINVSMATVYRNLSIMSEKSILRRIAIPGRPDCFDKTVSEHSHKICQICGEVSDIEVGDLKHELEKRAGISITDYDLCVRYICPLCRQQKNLLMK